MYRCTMDIHTLYWPGEFVSEMLVFYGIYMYICTSHYGHTYPLLAWGAGELCRPVDSRSS